jgi:hypothetical protein
MTVPSGNGKSDLHKQNVSVCFFSKQKCRHQCLEHDSPTVEIRYSLDVANVVENVLHILLHPHVHCARILHKE